MKAFYLGGSIIFTALILILAFENISAQCSNLHFLFFPIQSNPTVVALGIAVIGILTGALYHAFMVRVLDSSEDEDYESF
ncbi:hypothetical protein GF354_04915 [Candidatus Peregrinibacteria bacterium]|nr:hypothetical protein [Candidatus Peregrinibacteria bacterium]